MLDGYTVFAILFLFCVFSCKSNLTRKTSDEHCLYEQLKFATCKWSICDFANVRFIMLSCSYSTKGPQKLKDSVSTGYAKSLGMTAVKIKIISLKCSKLMENLY